VAWPHAPGQAAPPRCCFGHSRLRDPAATAVITGEFISRQ